VHNAGVGGEGDGQMDEKSERTTSSGPVGCDASALSNVLVPLLKWIYEEEACRYSRLLLDCT